MFVCIPYRAATISQSTGKNITYCPKMYCSQHAFTIFLEKSVVVFFMWHRLHTPDNIGLGGYAISVKYENKYLSIVLDNKLLRSSHIDHLRCKCERGLNALKCVPRTKWGTDPRITSLFIEYTFDQYSCILFNSAANVLKNIDRI